MLTVAPASSRTFNISSWPLELAHISAVAPVWNGRTTVDHSDMNSWQQEHFKQPVHQSVANYLREKSLMNSKTVVSHSSSCSKSSYAVWWHRRIIWCDTCSTWAYVRWYVTQLGEFITWIISGGWEVDVGGRAHRKYGLYFISLYSSRLGLNTSPLVISLDAIDPPVQWFSNWFVARSHPSTVLHQLSKAFPVFCCFHVLLWKQTKEWKKNGLGVRTRLIITLPSLTGVVDPCCSELTWNA